MLIKIGSFLFFALCLAACTATVKPDDSGESSSSEAQESPVYSSSSSSDAVLTSSSAEVSPSIMESISEDGIYTSKDSVGAYICLFGKLPSDYRTKDEAEALYEQEGNAFTKWNFNPWTTLGVMVGGDVYSDDANALTEGSYYECDVDYSGANRGTKRLIYTDSCIIYYTADHYETFTQIYGMAE
ncbi:MAG: hypothetical protein M0P13_11385 [Fibrobacteraceae bacterium]|nr:hypothetical protein [Fibrobacteraceae bacterium]